MKVSGADLAAYLSGHAEVEPGRFGGVIPHRLPAHARVQTDDIFFRWVERCPAGVTLRFRTDAPRLTLSLQVTGVTQHEREQLIPRLSVREGGISRAFTVEPLAMFILDADENVTFEDAEPATLVIEREGGLGNVEVRLPHNGHVELVALEGDGQISPAELAPRPRWLHYGSSISHCVGSLTPDLPWPAQVADATGWELRNLAFAGNAQLDQFAARVIRDATADLITLKLGINIVASDSMRERSFQPALHAFLETVRDGHQQTPVLVYSPISCPLLEHRPGPVVYRGDRFHAAQRRIEPDDGALTLARTRELVEAVVQLRQAGDPNLHYVDGRELFGDADVALLDDALHPDQQGCNLIATRFVDTLPAAVRPGA